MGVFCSHGEARPRGRKTEAQAPWAVGVSQEDQTGALEFFRKGNDQYGELDFKAAVLSYESALALWSHPRIHGNLVSALVKLEWYEKAVPHIEAALKYGDRPFSPKIYAQLLENKILVEGKFSRLVLSCKEQGAVVFVDSQQKLECPGQAVVVVRAGKHKVIAEKHGFFTTSKDVDAGPDGFENVSVDPVAIQNAVRYERRWPQSVPWAVVGTGVGAAAVGIPFLLFASDNNSEYDEEYGRVCPRGCERADFEAQRPGFVKKRTRAKWQNIVGVTAVGVGAVGAFAGVVLLYLNQPKAVDASPKRAMRVSPWYTNAGQGVAFEFVF